MLTFVGVTCCVIVWLMVWGMTKTVNTWEQESASAPSLPSCACCAQALSDDQDGRIERVGEDWAGEI